MSDVRPLAASGAAAASASPAATRTSAGPLAQFAWALFDGARSPYNVLVNIFVFSAYFSTAVIPDPVRGQTMWSFVTSTAALIVALTAPVLGAVGIVFLVIGVLILFKVREENCPGLRRRPAAKRARLARTWSRSGLASGASARATSAHALAFSIGRATPPSQAIFESGCGAPVPSICRPGE